MMQQGQDPGHSVYKMDHVESLLDDNADLRQTVRRHHSAGYYAGWRIVLMTSFRDRKVRREQDYDYVYNAEHADRQRMSSLPLDVGAGHEVTIQAETQDHGGVKCTNYR